MSVNSFNAKKQVQINNKQYTIFSLKEASRNGLGDITRLPVTLRILLENLLRNENNTTVKRDDIAALAEWQSQQHSQHEIAFYPARVIMQDFTGVPAIVDLAAMRDAMEKLGGEPERINPMVPVDLVIDHSVMVDRFATVTSFRDNITFEYRRNRERYRFLKWGQNSFQNFRVVPPGTGIVHQVNLEYLGKVVRTCETDDGITLFNDTCIGTDSHTTMINALSILGWGVGGIEAEAVMLGQPYSMVIPDVVGYKLTGSLKEGTTATDLVLTITENLRKLNVVGKFVEFYGPGLSSLTLADRATIANMAPEYGATCGLFTVDEETVKYLEFTGRTQDEVTLAEEYYKEQGLWRDDSAEPLYTQSIELDLASIEPSIAGPKRPQDRVPLSQAASSFKEVLHREYTINPAEENKKFPVNGKDFSLSHGSVCIAAITSCTNTSNPSVLIAAGLVAKRARESGLTVKPWVKTSFAPGSKVVSDYLVKSGLQEHLDALGFNLVGYGCTTCIGNSGPLDPAVSQSINENNIISASVLSGNRNFEGRISPDSRANYLASPPLVVLYAIAGTMNIDLCNDPIAQDTKGNNVYLKDLWPAGREIQEVLRENIDKTMFRERYSHVFKGDSKWNELDLVTSRTYNWDPASTYIQKPPYFDNMTKQPLPVNDIADARPLLILGDSVTTDHISPAGAISAGSPAGRYLQEKGVTPDDFNSYGSRRGNHRVMLRGTFANIRIRNRMLDNVEGGFTRHFPDNTQQTVYDCAVQYKKEQVPLVVIAGREYGTGSSRDWAAKGTLLLGVKAVIAESYERIHRSNLIGMGVLPLQFAPGTDSSSLDIRADDTFSITGLASLAPGTEVKVAVKRADNSPATFNTICRIDTNTELAYYRHGSILHKVLRDLADI